MQWMENTFFDHLDKFGNSLGYENFGIAFMLSMVPWESPTDRDNFRFKRIELTGSLIYDLFREYYLIQKKDITRKIDEEYYYHKGSYKEDDTLSRKEKQALKKKVQIKEPTEENKYKDNFIGLIESNVKSFFKDRLVEQGFRKAFKGNWD